MALRTLTRTVHRPSRNGTLDHDFAEVIAAANFNFRQVSDREWLAANIVRSQNASQQAWADYERLGEVHKAISRASRIAGYAKLRVVKILPDGGDGETVETGRAADIVAGIYSRFGGVRGLIDRYFALMKVPGDSYLIRFRDDDGELDGYHFLSSDEIQRQSVEESIFVGQGGADLEWITLPGSSYGARNALTRTVEGRDVLGRVWLPGRRFVDLPDSPLAALSTECEVLWGLTESMKANIWLRFITAGMLAFPAGMTSVRVAGMGNQTEDFLTYIMKAMERNVADPTDPRVRIPLLIQAKGEDIERIKYIEIDREVFEQDLKFRSELIERILFGLDIQTQATKGSEDANHFTAWVQSDEEVRVAIQPDLDTMCWALTRMVLHREMEEAGESPEDIVGLKIAWDMSDSAVRTNSQEDTRQAFDRGWASGESVMRRTGLSVTDDRPPDWQLIRLVGMKTENPYLALISEGTTIDSIDWSEEGPVALFAKVKPGPTNASNDDPKAGPGVGSPGSPGDGKRTGTKKAPE